jgi:hypothetical protein
METLQSLYPDIPEFLLSWVMEEAGDDISIALALLDLNIKSLPDEEDESPYNSKLIKHLIKFNDSSDENSSPVKDGQTKEVEKESVLEGQPESSNSGIAQWPRLGRPLSLSLWLWPFPPPEERAGLDAKGDFPNQETKVEEPLNRQIEWYIICHVDL